MAIRANWVASPWFYTRFMHMKCNVMEISYQFFKWNSYGDAFCRCFLFPAMKVSWDSTFVTSHFICPMFFSKFELKKELTDMKKIIFSYNFRTCGITFVFFPNPGSWFWNFHVCFIYQFFPTKILFSGSLLFLFFRIESGSEQQSVGVVAPQRRRWPFGQGAVRPDHGPDAQ